MTFFSVDEPTDFKTSQCDVGATQWLCLFPWKGFCDALSVLGRPRGVTSQWPLLPKHKFSTAVPLPLWHTPTFLGSNHTFPHLTFQASTLSLMDSTHSMGVNLGLLPFEIQGQEGAYTACYWDVREEDGRNLRIVWVLGCWMWVEKNKGGRICSMGWWRNWA